MAKSAPPPYLVVGVGGDSDSMPAARWAVREAEARGLQLVVAHGASIPYGDPELHSGLVETIVAEAEAVVDRTISQLVIPPGLDVRTDVEPLPPVALLRRLAEDAQFMVLGRDTLTAFRRITEGAVTAPICAIAPCPVVVVPVNTPPTPQQPVVVALDGTTAAASALRVAFEEAALWRLPLMALHTRPDDDTADEEGEAERVNIEEILAGWKADNPDLSVHTRVVAGDPAEVIAESSAHAALMVVGRPHRRRVRSWARSVANAVLGHCECPLVVVPESPLPSRRTAPDRTLTSARR